MNYIVIDLEWNQAVTGHSKDPLIFEIIEIGAVKLNSELKEIGRYQKLVKPVVHEKINPRISNITKIKTEDLKFEKKFPFVFNQFIKWCGEDYIMCTFGITDLLELQRNMRFHNIENPWKYPLKYIDVQNIFLIDNPEYGRSVSLINAVKHYNIKQNKVYHRALTDALYTCDVIRHIKKETLEKCYSLDYINKPSRIEEMIPLDMGNHYECISPAIDFEESLMNNQFVRQIKCPLCNKKVKKKLKWYSDGVKYRAVALCSTHGKIEGEITVKKSEEEGMHFAIKKLTFIDDERYQQMKDRINLKKEKKLLKEQEREQEEQEKYEKYAGYAEDEKHIENNNHEKNYKHAKYVKNIEDENFEQNENNPVIRNMDEIMKMLNKEE